MRLYFITKIAYCSLCLSLCCLAGTGCGQTNKIENDFLADTVETNNQELKGSTIETRFKPPAGFQRIPLDSNSFGAYLRKLPLKPSGSPVLLFDGKEKPIDDEHAAVVNMDIGKKDLQQCADAIMRLRAEHLWKKKAYDSIHFNLQEGPRAEWLKWAKGERPVFAKGKVLCFVQNAKPESSYQNFRQYLDFVFAWAGSASLEKELNPVSFPELNGVPGDIMINGGFPGHAIIVADVAINSKSGEKLFLFIQSYMPAQEIHVIINPNEPEISPWYRSPIDTEEPYQTASWDFNDFSLKRFMR